MVDTEDIDDEEMLAATPDRPRGILTRRERKYYLGQSDIEPGTQAERSLRQSVRQHLTQAILDFTILYQCLETRDLDAVFEAKVAVDGERVPTGYVRNSVKDMIAFLYRHVDNEYRFERLVTEGIERAVHHAGWSAQVNVDIDVELEEPIDDIHTRLKEDGPDAVSRGELRTLLEAGELSDLEYAKLLVERSEDRSRRREIVRELTEVVDEQDTVE